MTAAQQAWLNRARQWHADATLLYEREAYGSAASRAYYGAFAVAKALLRATHKLKHDQVAGLLGRQFVIPGLLAPAYARRFNHLRALRERADYRLIDPEPPYLWNLLERLETFVAEAETQLT